MLGNCLVVQNVERKNFQLQKIYQMRAAPPSMWCRTAKLEGFQLFQFGHIVQSIHISHIWKNWTLKVKVWTLKASHRQDCTASTRVPLTTNRGRTIYPFNRLIFYSCSRKNSSQNLYGQKMLQAHYIVRIWITKIISDCPKIWQTPRTQPYRVFG